MRGDREYLVNREQRRLGDVPETDRLLYAADLISELQALIQAQGHETLEGLLALSQAEARRLAKEVTG